MTDPRSATSRRDFFKDTGALAAVSAFAGLSVPSVYAGQDSTIQVALVGCGGRGTGAAENALAVQNRGPIKLVAMADVFEDKLNNAYDALAKGASDRVDVPAERKFLGFDAYKKAMDCLKAGDVVILTTPPAFRWPMYTYAIEKGLHVFMEKPVTVDAPTSQKMLDLNEKAKAKNLKVGVGLMCRHCEARGELYKRIKDDAIGDLILLRAYRVVGPTASAFSLPKPADTPEVMYQIRNFHSFLWASGGAYSDFLIHNIDECCWMKDAWPVSAKGFGGRHYRGDYVDQNFDTYTTEYTFEDGAKLLLQGRCMTGAFNEFASYAQGSKGSAVISSSSHSPARPRIYKTQKIGNRKDMTWSFGRNEPNPYQLEWDALIAAIREDTPYNEVERGVMASLVTSMGRMACHTAQEITMDEFRKVPHEFAPGVDELGVDRPAPLASNAEGKYPVPQPGILQDREYKPFPTETKA
jgi:predicted dehydrogenase